MSRLTERTRYGIVGNNDRVINYPLYKIADADPLDRRIVGQCFEKLAWFEDAEEQGLLLRLPCKVGDTVYYINFSQGKIEEDTVIEITLATSGLHIRLRNSQWVMLDVFKKHFSITKEEAEQKLASMQKEVE